MAKITLIIVVILLAAVSARAQPAASTAPAVRSDIQREVERQGSVGERLGGIIERFGFLVRDLHSNGYLDDAQATQLTQMAGNLRTLNAEHVKAAADALEQAMQTVPKSDVSLKKAGLEVEIILRELSVFLLRANSAQARAMLLSELRDLINKEQSLNNDTILWGRQVLEDAAKAADQGKNLAGSQEILASRMTKFQEELGVAEASDPDPLNKIRMANAARVLVDRKVVPLLTGATADLNQPDALGAVAKQKDALKGMREAEAILSPDRELQNLLKAREDLRKILEDQTALRRESEKLPIHEFDDVHKTFFNRQHDLTVRLGAIDIAPFNPTAENEPPKPSTPGPSPASELPTVPLDVNPISGALVAMGQAEKALEGSRRPESLTAQRQAEAYLARALAMADALLAKLNNLNTLAAAVERSRRTVDTIREFQAIHNQIRQATSRAVAETKDSKDIGKSQRALAAAVENFTGTMQPSAYGEPIKRQLTIASGAMGKAAGSLDSNQPTAAQPPQADAANALAAALELAELELENAVGKYDKAKEAEENKTTAQKIEAVASQQKGLLDQATKGNPAGQPPATQAMATTQAALAAATTQMAQQAESEPMNIALDKTSKEMEKAAKALQQNMPEAPKLAAPYMKEALDTLKVAKNTAEDDAAIDDMEVEMQAEIEKIDVKVLNLLQRQKELREQTEKADATLLAVDIAGEQTVLHSEAMAVSEGDEIIGKEYYQKAAAAMKEAIGHLNLSKRPEAVAAQKRAEKELADVELALREAMKKITTLEDADEEPTTPEERGKPHPPTMDVVTKTLIVAAKERNLRLQARQTVTKELPALAPDQDALKEVTDTLGTLKGGEVAQEFFDGASGFMGEASGSLKQQKPSPSAKKMQDAEIELRKALVALAKNMKPRRPHPPKPEPPHPMQPTQEQNPDPQEGERNFSRKDPEGDKPKENQGTWQTLGPRERDALNQNFSRDLPIEYREMLKDYYETLAKQKQP